MRKTTSRKLTPGLLAVALACTASAIAGQPGGSFRNPKPIPGIPTTPKWDSYPTVTRDELTIIFVSEAEGSTDANFLPLLCQGRRNSQEEPFVVAPLGETINGTADGLNPSLGASMTADGLVLVFTRDRVGGSFWDDPTLYEARRASVDAPFGDAVPLPGVINASTAYAPDLSSDGTLLLFSSLRAGGMGEDDIWVCTRDSLDSPFGAPVNANDFFPGSQINTGYEERGPSLSTDRLTLFFSDGVRCRPGGGGSPTIWVCSRPGTDSPFAAPVSLDEMSRGSLPNPNHGRGGPCISRDWPAPGSKLYYAYDDIEACDMREVLDVIDLDLWEVEWTPLPPTSWSRIQTAPAVTPGSRSYHGMVYDSVRGEIVVHGGLSDRNGYRPLADTWAWDGETWTLRNENGPENSFVCGSMAFDPIRGVAVVYGRIQGVHPDITFHAETWEWDGETWTLVDDGGNGGPGVRGLTAMAFCPGRGTILLQGGTPDALAATVFSETWEWDGVTWREIPNAGGPNRVLHRMAYDPEREAMVLFGGRDSDENGDPIAPTDTWEFSDGKWRQVDTVGPIGPEHPERVNALLAWDPIRHAVIMSGGGAWASEGFPEYVYQNDTWEWNGRQWTEVETVGARLPAVLYAGGAYDTRRQRWVQFGGQVRDSENHLVTNSETWEYGLLPLRITDVSSREEGMLEIHWTGEAPPYQLQSRDSLSEGDWQDEGEPTNAFHLTVPAAGPARFFRVLSRSGDL